MTNNIEIDKVNSGYRKEKDGKYLYSASVLFYSDEILDEKKLKKKIEEAIK